MSTVVRTCTNGVSFGTRYTVSAQDVIDGAVLFDFSAQYPMAGAVVITTAGGVNVALSDAVVTFPADGQIRIANGASTFTLVAGWIISIVAQRASED